MEEGVITLGLFLPALSLLYRLTEQWPGLFLLAYLPLFAACFSVAHLVPWPTEIFYSLLLLLAALAFGSTLYRAAAAAAATLSSASSQCVGQTATT